MANPRFLQFFTLTIVFFFGILMCRDTSSNMMVRVTVLSFFLAIWCSVMASPDPKALRCLVCQTLVEEIEKEIRNVDPRKKVDVGSYRIDSNGNQNQKSVPYARSEVHMSELLENVCNKMDDYVRATYKSTGELTILKLIGSDGKLNEEISKVDIIQDSDLNKSLKFYCEEIVGENEDSILKIFSHEQEEVDVKLCADEANLCAVVTDEDDEFTGNDEL